MATCERPARLAGASSLLHSLSLRLVLPSPLMRRALLASSLLRTRLFRLSPSAYRPRSTPPFPPCRSMASSSTVNDPAIEWSGFQYLQGQPVSLEDVKRNSNILVLEQWATSAEQRPTQSHREQHCTALHCAQAGLCSKDAHSPHRWLCLPACPPAPLSAGVPRAAPASLTSTRSTSSTASTAWWWWASPTRRTCRS